jgi:nicotinamidase-related amidase
LSSKKGEEAVSVSQNTALLIVDTQNDMLTGDAPVYQAEEVVARIQSLLARARSAGVPVLYVQHCEAEGGGLAPNTDGWQIHAQISPQEGETVVHKWHPDSFQGTPLQQELEARGIGNLVIAGLQTEMCIDTTCRRAYSLGYKVTLVADAHSTWDNGIISAPQIIAHHNATLGWFAKPQSADNITFDTP